MTAHDDDFNVVDTRDTFGIPELNGGGERCAACGKSFATAEIRHVYVSPKHWVVQQTLGPIHGRCVTFSRKQESALATMLAKIPGAEERAQLARLLAMDDSEEGR